MSTPTLEAVARTVAGKKVSQLRRQGLVPAVMYGHKKEALNIAVNGKTFAKLYQEVGSSTLVDLKVEGAKAPVKVLIHEVQEDALSRQPQHVDFYIVNLKEKLQTAIALAFTGTAPAVDVEGGTLITPKDELNVECLPDALVPEIEVDISSLATFDDIIRVSDLKVPAGMTVLDDAEETVASVA